MNSTGKGLTDQHAWPSPDPHIPTLWAGAQASVAFQSPTGSVGTQWVLKSPSESSQHLWMRLSRAGLPGTLPRSVWCPASAPRCLEHEALGQQRC